jgi:hypothetical protein
MKLSYQILKKLILEELEKNSSSNEQLQQLRDLAYDLNIKGMVEIYKNTEHEEVKDKASFHIEQVLNHILKSKNLNLTLEQNEEYIADQNDEPIIFYDVEFSGIALGTIEINREPYLPDQPHIFREESISLFGEEPSSPGIGFFSKDFEITLEGQQLDKFEDIIQRTEFEALHRVQWQIGRGVEPRPEEVQRMRAELMPERLKGFIGEQLENYIFKNSESFIKFVLEDLANY